MTADLHGIMPPMTTPCAANGKLGERAVGVRARSLLKVGWPRRAVGGTGDGQSRHGDALHRPGSRAACRHRGARWRRIRC
jgi:hypothetical protein